MPLMPIPSACLVPVPVPDRDQRAADADTLPAGVRLSSGSFFACPVQFADESSVQFSTPMGQGQISLVKISQLIFRPLTPDLAVKLQAGGAGLLLHHGDFVEGEFKGIVGGEIQINSIIFGLKSYPLAEAAALILRDIQPTVAAYELRLKNGSLLHARALQVVGQNLLVEDSVLKSCRLALNDLREITRTEAPAPELPIGAQARR